METMPFRGTRRNSSSLGLWVLALALFLAASDGQMAVPSTGQLCISDCSTCPVICTAPPPPALDSPPRSYSTYIPPPPPQPDFYGGYMAPPLPRASPVLTWTPPPAPPSSYFFWGPPPPVSNYFMGAQPSGQMPQTAGPRDYSYPYYYFYSSNSCSFSSLSTFVVLFVCLFHFVF